ncbi:hypothetical protein SprV_0100031200 [Sparganum proliferum]
MKATDTALARFYGLPKIYNANVPLRPIVALKGSPSCNLAKWMYLKLKFLQGNSTSSVRSASQFLLDLRGRRIQSDEIMVSFDVTSLFTSIPPKVAREVLRKRAEEANDETQNALKIEHLMRLFEFCQQTFFTFAGETYEQIKGTPMGSTGLRFGGRTGPTGVGKIAFIQNEPVFWRRYVDDTFVIVKNDMLEHLHSLLNAVLPDIKLTREEEQEQQLPFLDVLVRPNLNGELETTVYRKATNTTQLLSFHSNHPVAHKRSCVKTLFKRVQTHCSKPEDRAPEARYPRDRFVQKGYPRACISRCLRGRHQRTRTSTPPTIWHSLPYIKGVSEATERIAAELAPCANTSKARMSGGGKRPNLSSMEPFLPCLKRQKNEMKLPTKDLFTELMRPAGAFYAALTGTPAVCEQQQTDGDSPSRTLPDLQESQRRLEEFGFFRRLDEKIRAPDWL